MEILFDTLGWSGSGLIIIAYALTLIEDKKRLEFSRYLNLLGGLFIALNCYYYKAISPFITNLIWSIIASLTIYKSHKERKKCKKRECLV